MITPQKYVYLGDTKQLLFQMDLSKHFVLLNGEPKTLQIDTIQKVSSKQNDEHPRRSIRASASVDTDVCAGRCGRLRRSIRTSASVDADICVGRRGCSTTNINIRNETSSYHTKLSSAQPLLSANLQRRIHRRVAVGHEAQHQLA